MWDVFISYAYEDKDYIVQQLAEKLVAKGLQVLYDDFKLNVGDSLSKSIDEGLARSKHGIVILSKHFFQKEWPREEISDLVAKRSKIILVCHYISKEEITQFSSALADKIAIDTSAPLDDVISKILFEINKTNTPVKHIKGPRRQKPLCERLTQEHWTLLEQAVIKAVTAGGMAAMGFYRQTMSWPGSLDNLQGNLKNPSTRADLEATIAILHTVESFLAPFSRKLGCPLILLGEETKYQEWLRKSISQSSYESIKSPDEFFIEADNSIRVIFDGVDGTGSFIRGFPLFCSAVAILISNQPRVAAIYDPIHHVVNYGSLQGNYDEPSKVARAFSWEVATGNHTNLVKAAVELKNRELKEEAVGVHFTRSNPAKLREFLKPSETDSQCAFERLARASGGIFAINSGIVSMADVAKGTLGAFVNNVTNLWDVAAGEVLVRACCGRVTDFNDFDIDYSYSHQTSVVAAKQVLHSKILSVLKNPDSQVSDMDQSLEEGPQ